DKQEFHRLLTAIVNAPQDLYPDMALVNAVSQNKAKRMLAQEEEWF
ncbi:MAG: hypothetical protein HY081_09045, partial [Gammaproteobacteria bacterium]|nr:hypothetical protein [Gammaproteobacteria bacterium]